MNLQFGDNIGQACDMRSSVASLAQGFGGFGDATTTVETYKVGTLVIDLFDAKTE
jgi:hypothetical protein